MKTARPLSNPNHASLFAACCVAFCALCLRASAQGTAFAYQGRLTENGQSAEGLYDFRAQVYSRGTAGEPGDALVSGTIVTNSVPVSNGAFVLHLDFGAGPFNGEARWLVLQVRTNNAASFTTLSPRQPITSAPYAILSGRLSGQVAATQVAGELPTATLPTGGNWALNTTLTLDTSTLAVDPVNNRIGVGTATPGWPFHMIANQGVVRLDSTANTFGSVLELRNNTASPTYLGAINFNDEAGTYPGQIGYLANHDLIFRSANAERMRLSKDGRMDVPAANSSVALNTLYYFMGIPLATAVTASSDSASGTALYASSSAGTAINGHSVSGTAAYFNNLTVIEADSSVPKPHLRLHETQDGDFARLELKAADHPFWHIAVGGGAANQMNFYNSANGDVMTLSEAGLLTTKVLTITGGADIAEPFQLSEGKLPAGSVVVIDENNPGHLKLSTSPYDTRVAGIISGAGGVQAGLSLHQQGVMEGNQPVALTGRVYVRADASSSPIRPGDLLTTSSVPGHAMKVTDPARGQGAILGKAMTGLAEGQGLVLVLVSLQ